MPDSYLYRQNPITLTDGQQAQPAVDASGRILVTGGGSEASPSVTSEGATVKTDRSITASTTSQQAAPANTARRKLFFQNLDAAINVHINLGAAATTGIGSVRLGPGVSMELTGTSQTVNVIAASGTPLVTIWEF